MDLSSIISTITELLANLNLPVDKIVEFLQPVIDIIMGLVG